MGLFFQITSLPAEKASTAIANGNTNTNTNTNTNVNVVTFNTEKVEKMITSHGGQILSREGIRVLQKGPNSTSTKIQKTNRKCYIVHLSGAFNLDETIKSDALLSHISQHNLCKVMPVNAIWLQTCDVNRTEVDPWEHDQLFEPQSWPIRKLKNNGIKLKVAVTGFMGVQRIGLMHMLVAIGASYTENMGNNNTHLICKEGTGAKYEKAIEWGLHVVTVDWLYHIIQHGYEDDCEDPFSLLLGKEGDNSQNSQSTTILSSQDY